MNGCLAFDIGVFCDIPIEAISHKAKLMNIVTALPGYFNIPIGGYHVQYHYANLLQERGHHVTLIFPRYLSTVPSLKGEVGAVLWAVRTRIENRPLISSFRLHRGVKIKLVRDLTTKHLPDADVLIATAWETAEALRHAPPEKGRKLYIVYNYELFMTASPEMRERMGRTYTTDFEMIATSRAVRGMLAQCGATPVAEIPCGIDFSAFGIDVLPEEREALTLGFPLRREVFKGAADAIEAAYRLRDVYGDKLRVTCFGSHRVELPSWIRWCYYPSQAELRRFYNEQAVFMVPSHFEGFGLPGAEAMACGAALVTTDNGGSRDYANPERTALVVPSKRPDLLADAVRRLFENDALRIRLAHAAHEHIQQYRWERSIELLEAVLRRS